MPTDLRLALAPLRDEAEGGEGAGRLLLILAQNSFSFGIKEHILPQFLELSDSIL